MSWDVVVSPPVARVAVEGGLEGDGHVEAWHGVECATVLAEDVFEGHESPGSRGSFHDAVDVEGEFTC